MARAWSFTIPDFRMASIASTTAIKCPEFPSCSEITSNRGCQIKRRRERRIPPFFGVVRAAYPNVWFLTSNPL